MKNTTRNILLGFALAVGVLALLAAVPSQTDFDGTYFKTNTLPISLIGNLVNWQQRTTNSFSSHWVDSGTSDATLTGTATASGVLIPIPSASGSGLQLSDSDQHNADMIHLLHYGSNEVSQAYGIAILNYPEASTPLVIHQYSDQDTAVQIDNTTSGDFIKFVNATNGVISPGTRGSGNFFHFYSYDSGVQYEYGTLSDQLVFTSKRASKPWVFKSAGIWDALQVNQAFNGPGLDLIQSGAGAALTITQSGGASSVNIDISPGGAGFWPILLNGQDYGPKFETTTSGGTTLTVSKTSTGNGTAALIINKGTGYSLQVYNGTNTLDVIKPSGYVGILTNAPSEALEVLGNIKASGTGTFGSQVIAPSFQEVMGVISHAGTSTLDFSPGANANKLVLTGAVTIAFSNLETNRYYHLMVANAQATNCSYVLPAVTFMGYYPTNIVAGKTAEWFFKVDPQTNSIVYAKYVEQQ